MSRKSEFSTKQYLSFSAEIKAVGDEKAGIGFITGYASVFGVVDSYDEVVDPGAFTRSLRERGMPMMLMQHSWSEIAGIWTKAKEDSKGLMLEGEINLEVQKAREYYSLIKQGALKGLSIGFRTLDFYLDKDNRRHLRDVDLMEVSIVSFPANEAALINGVRSVPKTEREFEEFLRDAGYDRTQSKAIVSKGFRAYLNMQRDAEHDGDLKAALKKLAHNLKGGSHAIGR